MEQTKSLLTSKTFIGILVMVAGMAGNKLGVTITDADVNSVVVVASDVLQAVGALLATYGRIKATKVIK